MKTAILFFLLSIAATAGPLNENLKKALAKEWKIQQYETFDVQELPSADQMKDKIHLKEDMTFLIIENGKEYTGRWIIMTPNNYISCKSYNSELNKMYKIISCADHAAVFEFKDPDLIKTKYYLSAN